MHVHIEDDFPEICKAIQHRRAMYYLLVHESHFVEEMLKKGQIEERDASVLRCTLDAKIFNLTLQVPNIKLASTYERIMQSGLT